MVGTPLQLCSTALPDQTSPDPDGRTSLVIVTPSGVASIARRERLVWMTAQYHHNSGALNVMSTALESTASPESTTMTAQRHPVVVVEDLVVRYGNRTALDHISFQVPAGGVVAVLGPNGAGKTTLVRTLATLVRPTSGSVHIGGFDVVRQPRKVRRRIALAAQSSAIDADLTVRENIMLIGRLFGLPHPRARSAELVAQLDLADIADRRVGDLSGGNQRRADLALSLVSHPDVLLLDEPTTGLDPRARAHLWAVLHHLTHQGIAIVLTTQYLEEADRLADEVVLMDAGRVVATGSPDALKALVDGHTIHLTTENTDGVALLESTAARLGLVVRVPDEAGRVILGTPSPQATVDFLAELSGWPIVIHNIEVSRPSLDDVFFAFTSGAPQ
jgi:heme ABC exporter ATP-binding subunit CcmA